MRETISLVLLVLLTFSTPCIAMDPSDSGHSRYQLHFEADLTLSGGTAGASISVEQSTHLLREVKFRSPADLYFDFTGDGTIRRDGEFIIWQPPPGGGTIDYVVLIDHQRAGGGFDALMTDDWAVFRGDDLFPPASIRQRTGALATSTFSIRLPGGWSVVTPFAAGPNNHWLIDNPKRSFDRPVGWIIAGTLGVRRDRIAGIDITVAGPIGARVRRIGMLALLRWTLPLLTAEIVSQPDRISIVSAGAPMWRGGLSAPNSLYIHADRPLLSENATSTLLHELIHVLMPLPTTDSHDWIDEGIAEYVTLEILRRSGTISDQRFSASIAKFARRGRTVGTLSATHSNGNITARAVAVFHELDLEMQSVTDGRVDIFDLIRYLIARRQAVGIAALRAATNELTGAERLTALDDQHLPGTGSASKSR